MGIFYCGRYISNSDDLKVLLDGLVEAVYFNTYYTLITPAVRLPFCPHGGLCMAHIPL